MTMLKQLSGKLDSALRKDMDDFHIVAAMATETMAKNINGLHLLLACLRDPRSSAARVFSDLGFDIEKLIHHLSDLNDKEDGLIFEAFDEESAHPVLWQELTELAERDSPATVSEADLAIAALRSLDEDVATQISEWAAASIDEIISDIRRRGVREAAIVVFDEAGALDLKSFTRDGKRVIELAHREARSLGLPKVTKDIMMLALVESDGVFTVGVRTQAIDPDSFKQHLLLNLRGDRKIKALDYPLDKEHCHQGVIRTLDEAALMATQDGSDNVDDGHIVRALVAGMFGIAVQILNEMGVDLQRLADFAEASVAWKENAADGDEEHMLPSIAETEDELRKTVIGQDSVVDQILPLMKRMRFGYKRPGKPIGVFLFMGKSGTGKTLLARTMAKAVYGSTDSLLMLEMGQFKTDISVNQFIGAPPGYIGYGDGKLTNGLRDNPNCVVLFDEVEKASEQVFDVLLRFLDEGVISDPAGPVRDGTSCMIVMTTNIAADGLGELASRMRTEGPSDELKRRLREKAVEYFTRPELVNRIDELILFNPLGLDEFTQITEIQLAADIEWFMEHKNIQLTVDTDLQLKLGEWSFERHDEGARVVGKIVTNRLISPLIDFLTERDIAESASIRASLDDDLQVVFDMKALS